MNSFAKMVAVHKWLQAFIVTFAKGLRPRSSWESHWPIWQDWPHDLRKAVYAALAAAVSAALGCDSALQAESERRRVEGWVMLVAAFFVITKVFS